MSNISKININNVLYDIRDASAQSYIATLNSDVNTTGSVLNTAYNLKSAEDDKLWDEINAMTGGAGSIASQIENAINQLDSDITSTGNGSVVTNVVQTDGKVTVTKGDVAAENVTLSGVTGISATNVKAAIEELSDDISDAIDEAKTYTTSEIAKLDSSISADAGKVLTGVTITDGKLTTKTDIELTASNVAFTPAQGSSLTSNNVADALEEAAQSSGNALDEAKAYTSAEIAKLDYADTAVSGQFVTEVDQADGKITVQRSGITSSLVTRTTTTYVDGATVEAALEDLGQKISDNDVTLEVAGTPTENMLKTYVLSKGDGTEIGKIDIPKDLVVTSGSVITATSADTGCTVGEKYIKLMIANQTSPLYIAVADLVDIYTTEANAAEVQLTVDSNNEISADVVEVAASKIKLSSNYTEAATATAPATGDSVDTAVGKLQKEISDANSDMTSEISRVDGLVTTEQSRAEGVEHELDNRISYIEQTTVVLTASVDTATETLSLTTGTITSAKPASLS